MASTIELSEGMRLGIPFRAQKTITLDTERFAEYPYEFPEDSGINLIETADDMGDLIGYYGSAIAEVTSLNESATGYQFVSLTITEVEIEGKISITRQERSSGRGYETTQQDREAGFGGVDTATDFREW